MDSLKTKLIAFVLSGLGTALRRLVLGLVALLIQNHWLSSDLADAAAKVFTCLIVSVLEWLAFQWRTRDARTLQKAVGVEADGWVGPETLGVVAAQLKGEAAQ